MATLLEYKCPCCGGTLEFNSSVQKMKCPYCDTEFEVEALKSLDDKPEGDDLSGMNWDIDAGSEWGYGETDHMNIYSCESCGGEVIGDETLGATTCPYCGNHVVMKGKFAGDLRPDFVIPFKLDKQAAIEGLKKHFEGKTLLPPVFKSESHLEEIKGVYVPVWLYDAHANAGIWYKAKSIRRWSDSEYNYTKTDYYSVYRAGSLDFSDVPVDGSKKMFNEVMESLEPFDIRQAVDFQTAYLAGYLADRYDSTAEDNVGRANERIKKSTEETFRNTVTGYAYVEPESTSIRLSNGKAKYALYPVWLLTTSWRGENYLFAMNGQTGKFVGNLPVDKDLYKKWLFGLTGGIGAVIFALLSVFWLL